MPGARLSITYPPTPPSVSDLNFPPSFKQLTLSSDLKRARPTVRTTDWGDVVAHLKVKTPPPPSTLQRPRLTQPGASPCSFFFWGEGGCERLGTWNAGSEPSGQSEIQGSIYGAAHALSICCCTAFGETVVFLDALQGECVAVAAPPGLRRNPPLNVFNAIVRE